METKEYIVAGIASEPSIHANTVSKFSLNELMKRLKKVSGRIILVVVELENFYPT